MLQNTIDLGAWNFKIFLYLGIVYWTKKNKQIIFLLNTSDIMCIKYNFSTSVSDLNYLSYKSWVINKHSSNMTWSHFFFFFGLLESLWHEVWMVHLTTSSLEDEVMLPKPTSPFWPMIILPREILGWDVIWFVGDYSNNYL